MSRLDLSGRQLYALRRLLQRHFLLAELQAFAPPGLAPPGSLQALLELSQEEGWTAELLACCASRCAGDPAFAALLEELAPWLPGRRGKAG